jgi:perosamine synthetase
MIRIPIARPAIGEEEIDAVRRVMESGMIVHGPLVSEFERQFAEYCGTAHAIAVNSGTAALHAALMASGVGPGDEVIVPSFTFFATASSVSMCGARPVFADVDPVSFNIDPASIAERITEKTRAVIGVHLFGCPFDVRALQEICSDRQVALIEDAAQAHGAMYRGRKVGGFGAAGCFSFYATKNMLTGEGGMITTDDPALAERMRLLINHGQSQKYLHTCLGYNFRMTDMEASMGIVQLKRLDDFNRRRMENAAYLNQHIQRADLLLPSSPSDIRHVYHQYVVTLKDDFPLERAELMAYLQERGIGSAVHYPIPLHRQPLYESKDTPYGCPVSERLSERVLSLPVHPLVTQEDLADICSAMNAVG